MSQPAVDRRTLASWKHHFQDEADAAYLYDELAAVEPNEDRQRVYRGLGRVERLHVERWRTLLEQHGATAPASRPSTRARVLAWFGRRFGPHRLLPLLLREEGQEVRGYLALSRAKGPGGVRAAALDLARESAEHAAQLRDLSGIEGEPWHSTESGGLLRNVVYGFNDGLTANFGLVAGVIGAAVDPRVVVVAGVAGMIADALSMGSSGYLAAKSEQEVYAHEIELEREELRVMPDLEREELALLYEAKGVAAPQAQALAAEVMRDPERALAEKVREELHIGEAHGTPLREGWVTGLATAVGALIPVAPFLLAAGPLATTASFLVSMLSHFAVGAARSFFTGRGLLRSGLDMFVVGLGVAAVGYFVGDLAQRWLAT